VYSFWYECIQLVELFFNQLISLKSSETNLLYRQINLLNSLKTKLYKLSFREMRHDFEFFSAKNNHSSLAWSFKNSSLVG